MRVIFTCIILSVVLIASPERKIIVGSFVTEQGAARALTTFRSQIGTEILAAQERLGFQIHARASGRQYILVLEPFPSYREAKKVKKLLPKEYASAFINKYTPPKATPLDTPSSAPKVSVAKAVVLPTSEAKVSTVTNKTVVATDTCSTAAEPDVNVTQVTKSNASTKPVVHEELRVPSASHETSFIIDAVTMKLIDAKKAYYAVEGQTYGIMSPSGKFAFAQKEVAEEFVKQYGGRVVDYETSKALDQKKQKASE